MTDLSAAGPLANQLEDAALILTRNLVRSRMAQIFESGDVKSQAILGARTAITHEVHVDVPRDAFANLLAIEILKAPLGLATIKQPHELRRALEDLGAMRLGDSGDRSISVVMST